MLVIRTMYIKPLTLDAPRQYVITFYNDNPYIC